MKTATRTLIVAPALALALAAAPALAGGQWLHIRVDNHRDADDSVSINIPLGLVESLLPLVEAEELRGGSLFIDDEDFADLNLPELLRAVRDSPDATYVSVRNRDETARVAKEGDTIVVDVDQSAGHSREKVRVRFPLAVAEALIGDDPGQLDLLAGLRALGAFEGEDLVRIDSDEERVRVWVDSSETGD